MVDKKIYIKYIGKNGEIENYPINYTLKLIRKRNGMTQKQVAGRLNINSNSLGSYEKGKSQIPITVFLRLVFLYHINIINIY